MGRLWSRVALVSLVVAGSACSATKEGGTTTPLHPDTGADADLDTGGGEDTGALDDTGGGLIVDSLVAPDVKPGCASPTDCDGDGYPASSDCNDADATINPDAYDFPDDGIDNDCDGTKDNPVTSCAATVGSKVPLDYARAADLCPQRTPTKTGKPFDPVVKVEFGGLSSFPFPITTHTDAIRVGNGFGDNKSRMGDTLFGLQSGPFGSTKPRESKAYDGSPVMNPCTVIPLNAADCKSLSNGVSPLPGFGSSVQDWAEVKITIKVPSNAQAMLFDFAYFSSEFNAYWNSPFNDAFWALVTSAKIKGANVAKDASGLAITVNSGFFQLCPKSPGPTGVLKPEALKNCVGVDGDAAAKIFGTLKGTYFDGAGIGSTDDTVVDGAGDAGTGSKYVYGGGSGWLTAKFEVVPSETIVVRFIVHDTSDGLLDSAAIVDNIRWEKAPPKVPTGEVERPPR